MRITWKPIPTSTHLSNTLLYARLISSDLCVPRSRLSLAKSTRSAASRSASTLIELDTTGPLRRRSESEYRLLVECRLSVVERRSPITNLSILAGTGMLLGLQWQAGSHWRPAARFARKSGRTHSLPCGSWRSDSASVVQWSSRGTTATRYSRSSRTSRTPSSASLRCSSCRSVVRPSQTSRPSCGTRLGRSPPCCRRLCPSTHCCRRRRSLRTRPTACVTHSRSCSASRRIQRRARYS